MYRNNFISLIAFVVCLLMVLQVSAKENIGQSGKAGYKKGKLAAACEPATAQTDLDINNVRTRLLTGGDMWWNLSDAQYEIPRVEPGSGEVSVHSLFAGALWIGGIDQGGQLKIAAQTYRQGGNDFWPGPLTSSGTVDDQVCSAYDRHWKVNITEINNFREISEASGGNVPIGSIPRSILEWPGKGNPHAVGAKGVPLALNSSKNLAPFVDADGNGIYNPEGGDYPAYEQGNTENVPDQMIWWVYNDKGDVHTETGGEAIGLEVQATAFAFSTNDEVNDMTFYRYNVNNYSSSALDSVFFGQWVDADLGYHLDDYVGCDPVAGLGICYNGDPVDGPAAVSYGNRPPIIGVDFFQGPTRYTYDENGVVVDSEILGMSKFLYYNNDFTVIGNPEISSHFYGYLSGSWKDGSPFTFGGNGYNTGAPTDYMYPDKPGSGGWSECDLGITPADRRFMQSAGPFRLSPGAVNEVVVGVVWVRPNNQVGCLADFDLLKIADDKAQALFDNNFKLINGPDAPDLAIRELDKEIIISLEETQNAFVEGYSEADPIVKAIIESLNDPAITDSTYEFQGYKIFQLRNAQISASEFMDPTKARLIAQVDIEDGVANLVNFIFDPTVGYDVPRLMVNASDEGIKHTFRVTEDAFASGEKRLVNFKTYYFSVVSYAYNNYLPYDPSNPQSQKRPYLEGRQNIKVYSAVPHKPTPNENGMVLNAEYGDGPQIIRIEGRGNGGNVIDITPETEETILQDVFMEHPVYQKQLGPIDIKVYDPIKVPNNSFELRFEGTATSKGIVNGSTKWILTNVETGIEYNSDTTLAYNNEQLIPDLGISVTVRQIPTPGGDKFRNNGFLEATKTYADAEKRWLTAIPEGEQESIFNWLRAGSYTNLDDDSYDDYQYLGEYRDPNGIYEDILSTTWAPFALAGGLKGSSINMPARRALTLGDKVFMDSLHSVDIVLTPDKSKWTRCIVVEMTEDRLLAEGGKEKLTIRDHASWNKDVDANGNPVYDQNSKGFSYFPGYAINVETGERLNIIFSEDSWLIAENGNDMIWNPTSRIFSPAGPSGSDIRLGGKHYIYISNTRYDGGQAFHDRFATDATVQQSAAVVDVFQGVTWFSPSILAPGYELLPLSEGLIPTETRIRLRVATPYRTMYVTGENNGMNMYQFDLGELAPTIGVDSVAKSALDLIRVVPNPYYAYSKYEKSQLDNRVKVTNLPSKCTVSIYSTDGTLIRRFDREVPGITTQGEVLSGNNFDTSIEWDLRNHQNIPIASGMYLIHVEAPGIGEKVAKFFCVMRPIDLDTF